MHLIWWMNWRGIAFKSKCSHITKLWDIVENGSRSQDLPNKSISNSESVRSTSLKSKVDHDVLYKEFEAFMKPQRDLNKKTKSQGSTLLRGRSWTKMLNHQRDISSIWKSLTGDQSWNQPLARKVGWGKLPSPKLSSLTQNAEKTKALFFWGVRGWGGGRIQGGWRNDANIQLILT